MRRPQPPAGPAVAVAVAIAAALAAVWPPAPASARTVRSGGATRLKRAVPLDVSQILWEAYDVDEEGTVRLMAYSHEPAVGERFVLVDTRGPYAAVEVRQVAVLNSYGGPPAYEVIARYTESPSREVEPGQTAAIGPTRRTLSRARVLPYGNFDAGPSQLSGNVTFAVDGDGDGRADLAVGYSGCGDDVSQRWPDYGLECSESWIKEGTGWKVVEKSVRYYEGD